ncbi:uncharacterized protein LOC136091777 [Hydra vulgaris]|uniref:Uncharacterized protein LOC136091777 n=1 Tax=Hydra vulgaris TaxID=6087 RepID=A0ABM4DLY7_HYDVU
MYDLIFISETWFTQISASQLDNYSLVKKNRISHGGGVAIYIKRDLVVNEVSDRHLREILNNSNSEQIWCEIKIGNEIVLIGCVYKPPLSNINDINKTIILAKQAVDRKAYSCMLLAGDFNFPEIKWHDDDRIELLSGQNSAASVFLDTLANHNLEQLVDFSTFEASIGKAKNILDLIITDLSTRVINLSSSLPLGNSSQGHRILSWDYVVLSKNETTFSNKKYDFNKGDYINFATLIREYRKLRSQVQKACKRCVRVFEAQLASDKSNPKRVYAYAKAQQNVHVSISAISNAKGETLTEGIHIANRLNEHFKSVFVDDSKSSQLPIFERRHYQEDLGDITINFEATLAYLKGLNPNKSIGTDNISPKVLKECAAQMTYPLTLLYNKALSEDSTPTAWKQSHVTPLFKKGSRLDAANYRPVSITSAPCKVMEKIIREQITKYLEKTSSISHNQHGFMSKKGCTSNLLESVDYITKALSKRNFVDIAFLDFAKAFDKVSHRRLLHKLKAYGINGNVLKWIESFLISRKQRTVLVHKIYADDTKLLQEIRPEFHDADCLILQNDLNIVTEWSKEWLMELNVQKCKVMHLGYGNSNHEYVMNDGNASLTLEATDIERDLDQVEVWSKLYTTYVRPHLEFAIPVWCPYLKGDIKEIEKIQRKATKVPHDLIGLPYAERCRRLNFIILETRTRRGDLIQQFKLENGFESINWHNPPIRRSSSNVLMREFTYNNARHNFFTNRIVNDWNNLPSACKKVPIVNAFKNRIDKYFFSPAANSTSFTEDELHVY